MTNKLSSDAFRTRERALENEFFRQVDKKLLAELKAKLDASEQVRQFQQLTDFTDERLVNELIELGVSVESLTAMYIIPLVLVAWADYKVDSVERFDIMKVAAEEGIEADTPAGQLLNHWLNTRPTPKLKETWNHYVQAVLFKMTDKGRKAMKADIRSRMRSIASVSGGPLGLGIITSDEKHVIADIERAFE